MRNGQTMRLASIILAAGHSRRFGGDKLASDLSGRAVVDYVADLALLPQFGHCVAVTQDEARFAPRGILTVAPPQGRRALGLSLAAGIAAVAQRCDGAMVFLGDMPEIRTTTVSSLVANFRDAGEVVAPIFDGQIGHPVLFGRSVFNALLALDEDSGGRSVMHQASALKLLAVDDPAVLRDIDTQADLFAARQRLNWSLEAQEAPTGGSVQ